ncbi:MAG: hypothetical protein JOS17DRAFT_822267 [Linnemannia elongata]|nr:MAG: hypothetical protein JOS17DRAFT_822267 [Linnemannia elongata]
MKLLLSVVAASSSHASGLQARQDEETSSLEIEDLNQSTGLDQSTGLAPPDPTGKTNPDPAESATAGVTSPIPVSKSTTLSPTPAQVATVAVAKASPSTPSSSLPSSSTVISGSDSTNITTGVDSRKLPADFEFTWEFDKATLTVPPANLTLQVTLNSDATMVWSIANISGTATSYTWSTANIKTPSNLLMGMYTLNIFDAKIGKLGIASGGQLIPNSDLRFGLYIPESRIPGASKVQCGTCELASASAPLHVQRQVIIPLLIANIVTLVMTFT